MRHSIQHLPGVSADASVIGHPGRLGAPPICKVVLGGIPGPYERRTHPATAAHPVGGLRPSDKPVRGARILRARPISRQDVTVNPGVSSRKYPAISNSIISTRRKHSATRREAFIRRRRARTIDGPSTFAHHTGEAPNIRLRGICSAAAPR